jgi:multicomponent Na+:H+ antiporter subunit F
MIAIAAAAGAALAAIAPLMRLFFGPTLYDRVSAANGVALKAVLICAAFAAASGRPDWIDAAIALVAGLVIVNAAALKLFRSRTFQAPLARLNTAREG